jgi:hypothetical protein
MNQEQLLDHVAELLKEQALKGPGMILLVFSDEFKVYSTGFSLPENEKIVAIFDAAKVTTGLVPSAWLEIAKKVWACKSTSSSSIKFPQQPGGERGKPGRKPKPTDEPPKVG